MSRITLNGLLLQVRDNEGATDNGRHAILDVFELRQFDFDFSMNFAYVA